MYHILFYYLDDIIRCTKRKDRVMFDYIHNREIDKSIKYLDQIEDLNETYIAGQTYINCAVEHNEYILTKKMLDMGANPNIVTDTWCCPLVNAIKNKNSHMVNLLLDYGVNLDILYLFFDRLVDYGDEDLLIRYLDGCSYVTLVNLLGWELVPDLINERIYIIRDSLPVDNLCWNLINSYIY